MMTLTIGPSLKQLYEPRGPGRPLGAKNKPKKVEEDKPDNSRTTIFAAENTEGEIL